MPSGRDILYGAGALATCPFWGWRMARTGKWRTDWPGRFGRATLPAATPGEKTILLHAVSVGEVNAVQHIAAALAARPGLRPVVSSTTDTGFQRAQALLGEKLPVVRYPLDFSFAVERFLDALAPDAVALVELETWPTFIDACAERDIPVGVVSGRLSERSFRRYRWIRPLVVPMFRRLAAVGAGDTESARRFLALGAEPGRVEVTGSTKWSAAPEPVEDGQEAAVPGALALAEALGIDRSRPLIVAGSTGPGEEALLIRTRPKGAQLLIAPRKPERFEAVAALAPGIARRSEHPDGTAAAPGRDLFLLDTLGELIAAYALADLALVGRSFLGLHGSNPLEPAALGRPVVIGPHHGDFRPMVEGLREAGALVISREPGRTAAELLADPDRRRRMGEAGRAEIARHRGATDRNLAVIERLLERDLP